MGRTKRQHHIVRLFALALCLLLVATALPGRAYALSGTTGGLNWSLSGGTLRVSGSGPMPNYTDANMAPWYSSAQAVNRIIVEEGITSIGSLAFYGCSTALQATLPSTVERIGDRAFKNCTNLTWVSLPEGLTAIGEAAFESCETLNGIILPQSLRSIGNYAFERCYALSSIVIPVGVTDLGMVVFYHCTGLTRAVIRCPVDKLPDWFFYGCTGLVEVELPETVARTGDQVFHDCENLSTVYCSDAGAPMIEQTLQNDSATRFAVVVPSEEKTETSTVGATSFDEKTGVSTTVTVTQTEQAVITETTKTEYTYTVDGTEATFTEALEASGKEESKVETSTQVETTITATVTGSEGWTNVADAAKDAAVFRSDNSPVDVTVQMVGSTVSGQEVSGMIGVDTELKISTDEGCTWVVDTKKQHRNDFKHEIDLSFTTQLLEAEVKGIESDTVYQVNFASDIKFDAQVGVSLKVSNARQNATIYEKTSTGLVELCSVIVDENGCAWFPVSEVNQKNDYYVAVNDQNADTTNAIVPDSMLKDYGEHAETLTDASGKQYEVGERESRWGITGKQFTIYVVIGLGAIVLITTGVMITLNKISRSKAKYAAMAAADADDYEIDEDALRLQIMQEMLEEAKRKNSGE